MKEKSYDFRAGDVFLFSSDEIHCITEMNSKCRILNIHFAPRFLWANTDNAELLKLFFARSNIFENRIERSNPSTDEIDKNILTIEHELAQKNPGYEVMVKYKLLASLVLLIRNYGYTDDSVKHINFKSTIKLMERALNFINQNFDKPIALSDISAEAAMSQTYFSTVFNKA